MCRECPCPRVTFRWVGRVYVVPLTVETIATYSRSIICNGLTFELANNKIINYMAFFTINAMHAGTQG